jgi:type II secretory pathway pseudopilin PulG
MIGQARGERGRTGPSFRPLALGPGPSALAFTLVEMLVVIAVIVLLIGIGLGVIASVTGKGEEQATKMVMESAEAINTEYYSLTGTVLNHLGDTPLNWSVALTENEPFNNNTKKSRITTDVDKGTDSDIVKDASIERFIWATYKIRDIRENMYRFDKLYFNDNSANGFMELRDGWDTKLIYVSGVSHDDSEKGDDFLPIHDKPFFASAGPDGQWGDAQETDTTKNGYKYRLDNVYSFGSD